MKLRRIWIEQLRQFGQPLTIDGLGDGINLFVGPNESGKSTLVRAIRAAFFERCKSNSVDDLVPWGDSAAAPTVELEFDWQGERWQLTKSFLRRKRCDLRVGGRTLNGEEAEDRLAGLLGFQFAGRGASRPELWGIPGLLWLEQGAAPDVGAAVQSAGDHLKSALGASLGEVASSAGDEVLARIERERSALLTAANNRPSGEYRRAIEEHATQRAELDELDTDLAAYRQQVDRLGELLERQRGDHARPWEELRRQAEVAARQRAEIGDWQDEQKRAHGQLESCLQQQELCRGQLQEFAARDEELLERRQQQTTAEAALEELRTRQPALETRLLGARKADEAARAALQQALQQQRRVQLESEIDGHATALSRGEQNLQEALGLRDELLRLRTELQAQQLDQNAVEQLRRLSRELEDIDLRQRAVATRLRFELLPGRTLTLGAEALSGAGERLLLEPVRLQLDGVGELYIQPGGEDLTELLRERQRVENALVTSLTGLGVTGVGEVEARVERSHILRQEITGRELQMKVYAPEGVDALQQQLQLGRSRIDELRSQLHGLPQPVADAIDVDSARHQAESAERVLDDAERAAGAFREQLGIAEHAYGAAHREYQRIEEKVEATGYREPQRHLQAQLIGLQAAETSLRDAIGARQTAIDAAQPQLLEQDQERLNRSADICEREAHERAREVERLQGSLEGQGAQGLEERRAEALQKLELAARRRDELERRAQALDLLLGLLRGKRHQLTQRLQAPLQRHLGRYLQLLFPQASLEIDENLVPQTLLRRVAGSDQHGGVAELSFGAREQTGLISRLAYADLLHEAGRPTLIILDDALVHTDRERLERMKRILFDAAERHQILLFSCHPENWRDLGVAAREMSAL